MSELLLVIASLLVIVYTMFHLLTIYYYFYEKKQLESSLLNITGHLTKLIQPHLLYNIHDEIVTAGNNIYKYNKDSNQYTKMFTNLRFNFSDAIKCKNNTGIETYEYKQLKKLSKKLSNKSEEVKEKRDFYIERLETLQIKNDEIEKYKMKQIQIRKRIKYLSYNLGFLNKY